MWFRLKVPAAFYGFIGIPFARKITDSSLADNYDESNLLFDFVQNLWLEY
jgi:hypothetical protein